MKLFWEWKIVGNERLAEVANFVNEITNLQVAKTNKKKNYTAVKSFCNDQLLLRTQMMKLTINGHIA